MDENEAMRERLRAAEQRAAKLAQASAALRETLECLRTADDLEALLGHTLKSIADQLGVRTASACVFDPDRVAHLVWAIEDGRIVPGPESSHANADRPSQSNTWHHQWPSAMDAPAPNVTPVADHPGMTPEQRAFLLDRGVRALIAVPMVLRGQLVGSFTLHLGSDTYPLGEDLELIQALANQASLAFHLTRLADEARAAAVARELQRAADARAAQLARANAALRTTLARLQTADNLDELLGETLDLLAQHLDARSSAVYVAGPAHALECAWVLAGGPRVRRERPLPARWRDRAVDRATSIVVSDDRDDELGTTIAVDVPILLGTELVGLYTFGLAAGRPSVDDLELLQALANQAAIAMKLARLAKEARAAVVAQEEERAARARAAAVAEERSRLAREIHDTIAQGLAAIIRQLESAAIAPEAAADHVALAATIARDSLVEARRSIRALRPPALEGRTLEGALRDLVERSGRVAACPIRAEVSGSRSQLPSEVEDELYRIANEALTNAIKHASAQTIDVELAYDGPNVRVAVRDDGVGFDAAVPRDGIGMSSMRERAARIGAAVTVATEPGNGTEVLAYWTAP